jgi:hypothetical protein
MGIPPVFGETKLRPKNSTGYVLAVTASRAVSVTKLLGWANR